MKYTLPLLLVLLIIGCKINAQKIIIHNDNEGMLYMPIEHYTDTKHKNHHHRKTKKPLIKEACVSSGSRVQKNMKLKNKNISFSLMFY